MTLTSNRAHIAAFTSSYVVRGIAYTGTRRLSDALNDRITAYMELEQARVYNLLQPQQSAFSAPTFYLKKEQLAAVAVIKEEIVHPPRRLFSYVAKERYEALLILSSYELRGYMHVHGKHDVTSPLIHDGEWFFPVTDATLMATSNAKIKIEATTILVREAALDGFHLGRATPQRDPTGQTDPL